MGLLDQAIHLANFVAPAVFLAVLLAVIGRFVNAARPLIASLWAQAAINFVAGVVVLGAGLWWFGRDGKIATYGTLVAVMATVQWLSAAAWRR